MYIYIICATSACSSKVNPVICCEHCKLTAQNKAYVHLKNVHRTYLVLTNDCVHHQIKRLTKKTHTTSFWSAVSRLPKGRTVCMHCAITSLYALPTTNIMIYGIHNCMYEHAQNLTSATLARLQSAFHCRRNMSDPKRVRPSNHFLHTTHVYPQGHMITIFDIWAHNSEPVISLDVHYRVCDGFLLRVRQVYCPLRVKLGQQFHATCCDIQVRRWLSQIYRLCPIVLGLSLYSACRPPGACRFLAGNLLSGTLPSELGHLASLTLMCVGRAGALRLEWHAFVQVMFLNACLLDCVGLMMVCLVEWMLYCASASNPRWPRLTTSYSWLLLIGLQWLWKLQGSLVIALTGDTIPITCNVLQ